VHAEFDALIADEHRRPGDELAHLVLALPAERAVEGVFRISAAGLIHASSVRWPIRRRFKLASQTAGIQCHFRRYLSAVGPAGTNRGPARGPGSILETNYIRMVSPTMVNKPLTVP